MAGDVFEKAKSDVAVPSLGPDHTIRPLLQTVGPTLPLVSNSASPRDRQASLSPGPRRQEDRDGSDPWSPTIAPASSTGSWVCSFRGRGADPCCGPTLAG